MEPASYMLNAMTQIDFFWEFVQWATVTIALVDKVRVWWGIFCSFPCSRNIVHRVRQISVLFNTTDVVDAWTVRGGCQVH